MSKRKHGEMSMIEVEAATIARLRDELPADLAPFLDKKIQELYEKTIPLPKLPTRPATWFKTVRSAAEALGLDYAPEYKFKLKETTEENVKELSLHFAAVIDNLISNKYIGAQVDETFSRTILDLILLDRLQHFEDKDTFHKLILSTEVSVSIEIDPANFQHRGIPELVRGRVDWALGYGNDKTNTGSILIVVEAKRSGSASTGLPQMVVYMAAVQKARRGHSNKSVFGMLSDSSEFRFAFLDSNKKLHVSTGLDWTADKSDQQAIISYIDVMLLDAIQSSPHTTPVKTQNNTLKRYRYRQYLGEKWAFGRYAEEEDVDESEFEADGEEKAIFNQWLKV